jgi:hypothetical protein
MAEDLFHVRSVVKEGDDAQAMLLPDTPPVFL